MLFALLQSLCRTCSSTKEKLKALLLSSATQSFQEAYNNTEYPFSLIRNMWLKLGETFNKHRQAEFKKITCKN